MPTRWFLACLALAGACGGTDGPPASGPDAGSDGGGGTGMASLRPPNPSCKVPEAVPETGSLGLPARLSETGCFDPSAPIRPLPGLIPYEVNMPLWSDGAAKERWLALPDGARMHVSPDGDLDLPAGSVTVKTFSVAGRRIETRFLVRLMTGEWAGYTYEWNEAGTDAVVLSEGSRRRMLGDQQWHYPTRAECLSCHTEAAGRTLGLELSQLNTEVQYAGGPATNQLSLWSTWGLFDAPLPGDPHGLPALPTPADTNAPLDVRARAYMHANCSICHRPGVELTGRTDFRFTTPLSQTMTCDAEPRDLLRAPPDARILMPGNPDKSMIVVRMLELGRGRMPEVGSLMVDEEGVKLVSDWIRALPGCPP
jgi:uncharacterized repeat protein (TIGR03806 family)